MSGRTLLSYRADMNLERWQIFRGIHSDFIYISQIISKLIASIFRADLFSDESDLMRHNRPETSPLMFPITDEWEKLAVAHLNSSSPLRTERWYFSQPCLLPLCACVHVCVRACVCLWYLHHSLESIIAPTKAESLLEEYIDKHVGVMTLNIIFWS